MPLLSDQDRKALETRFKKDLKRDVNMTLYTVRNVGGLILPGRECPTCPQTEQFLTEVAAASKRLHLTVKDVFADVDDAREHGIERVPCITLHGEGEESDNLLFYGIPAGYEVLTLIEDIIAASKGTSTLQHSTRKALHRLERPVHLQVFVTPT
ncbi:MAG: thioredoxin family protein [Chloroflexota bacterium]|nr:thioredoxin family protein [Chloroflexota bacterium]